MEELMFKRVLVANRGEIAVRIIRALRELDIESVAVYSEEDRYSLHAMTADYAYAMEGSRSRDTYSNIEKLLYIAKVSGADAVHPGYGFLSERAKFAEAVQNAGMTFIGPKSDIIRLMCDKIEARKLMLSIGVPVVRGSSGAIESYEEALEIAEGIGYPVLIKAAAGGGGMGMRVAWSHEELEDVLASVKNTAIELYSDGSIFVEKYITRPRHIEIQVMGDKHGNYVHLGERECSIQRRHQKVVEEAPSAALTPEIRSEMGKAAVSIARAVGYDSVGTVEFIYDNGEYYFLEMNTRIQVEHTITEMVTGIDIVRTQVEIAAGLPLSVSQEDILFNGHAIECRICAEDPLNSFLPSPGRISSLIVPGGPGVRVDSGIKAGYLIGTNYDSMLSKLICLGRNREESIARMHRALGEYEISGIKTNIPILMAIMDNEDYRAQNISTKFIEEHDGLTEEARRYSERKPTYVKIDIG
jgi:pyruvate carboxylase subunit A